jgi:cobalt-zinc-cadmium resistance protein CzcA
MKRYKLYKLRFIILILPMFLENISAQQTLSLEEAKTLAAENNLKLQAAKLDYKAAQFSEKTVLALPKTNINGLFGQTNSMRFDENISISQNIPNRAYIRAQREQARQEAQLFNISMDMDRRDINYSLSQSWYQWLYLKELKKTLQREDSLLLAFSKAADAKYRSGESRLLEKTVAENRRQQLLQEISKNEMTMKLELIKIKQLIGIKDDFVPKADSLQALVFQEPDSTTLQMHPMLRYLSQQANISVASQKTAAAEKLPEFSGGYFIQSLSGPQEINGQARSFNSTPQFQGVSLGISVPIFSGKAYKAKQEMYATQKLAREKEADFIKWQLEQEILQKVEEYDFWQQHLAYYRSTALPNAELIVFNATKSYQNGEIEYVEYLQALQTALESKKGYINTVNNLNQTIISIEFLLGN